MKKLLALSLALATNVTSAATLQETVAALKSQPYSTAVPNNNQIFSKYCVGNPESAEIPQPNYSNELVQIAAQRISETKNKANIALKKMAESQILNSIAQAKTMAQDLIKSPIAGISTIGKQLLAELELASIKGFTAKTSEFIKQLQPLSMPQLESSLKTLNANLPKELTGVDVPRLKTIIASLNSLLKSEIKPLDLSALKTSIKAIINQAPQSLKQTDAVNLKKNLVVIVSELASATNKSLLSAKEVANQALKNFDETTKTADGLYQVAVSSSDITFYVIDQYVVEEKGTISQALKNATDQIKLEYAKTNNKEILEIGNSLIENLNKIGNSFTADQLEEIKYPTNTLANLLDAAQQSMDVKMLSLNKTFQREAKKFSGQDVLDALLVTLKAIKNKESTDNIVNAANNLSYYIDVIKSTFTNKNTLTNVDQLKNELSKSQSSQAIQSVQQTLQALKNSKGIITEDNIYEITGASYQLEQVSNNLSKSSKVAVSSYTAAVNAIQSQQDLTAILKNSPNNVEADHFYFYGDIRKIYKLSKSSVSPKAPQGTAPEAHMFLTQLCGEFRDRSTMIEAKLNWLKNIFILEGRKETFTIDPTKNVWSQIPASAYYPYLAISRNVWKEKRNAKPRFITIGTYSDIDNPVDGFTVCETKYIFSEYVGKNKSFDSYEKYIQGLQSYRNMSGNCTAADQADYYDFRGDSNFKHYSPESNGMIWYATTIAKACETPTKVKKDVTAYTDQDCENYFKHPFYFRYNAARAGLATWLFRDDQYAQTFSSQGSMVAIYPHSSPDLAPFSFSFQNTSDDNIFGFDAKWLQIPGAWNSTDIGLNAFTGLGTNSSNLQLAYERIRDAVDRHTDWYSSGYNDKNGTVKDQAYSPFVASSYEMSSSDGFTSCGTTVQCPPDGLKRWMFVFRIKPQNWYNTARIVNNEPIDFDKMWFDETSFGRSRLADSEHAWDRLGTSMEDEMDSILYLYGVDIDEDNAQNGQQGE